MAGRRQERLVQEGNSIKPTTSIKIEKIGRWMDHPLVVDGRKGWAQDFSMGMEGNLLSQEPRTSRKRRSR